MTMPPAGTPARLAVWADAVLLPCFDGHTPPEWIRRRIGEGLGGVCLFARNVRDVEQVAALSGVLAAERESVVVAIDEEAGDVTRLDTTTGSRFPGAAAIGRVDDVALTTEVASEVGDLLAGAGVSVNFAPCADVASNPDNPVIGSRSFSADPAVAARHTAAWVRGQQSASVAACAKHFPGHGDTRSDSHRETSVVSGDLTELRTGALRPFAAAIEAGVSAVMAGHLVVPAIDALPATVSSRWLGEVLRGEMGFTGTVVTDALEMAAIAAEYGIAGGAVRALSAGADLLCLGGETRSEAEIDALRDAIVQAVLSGVLPEERLADAARRSARLGLSAVRSSAADRGPWLSPTVGAVVGRSAGASNEGVGPPVSLASAAVARQALQIATPLPRGTEPVLVVRCVDTPSIAVGAARWGLLSALPGSTTETEITERDTLPTQALAGAATVLVVVRDRHRHRWMRETIAAVRAIRHDAILVDMGIGGVTAEDAPAIASFGATLANSYAVAEALGMRNR